MRLNRSNAVAKRWKRQKKAHLQVQSRSMQRREKQTKRCAVMHAEPQAQECQGSNIPAVQEVANEQLLWVGRQPGATRCTHKMSASRLQTCKQHRRCCAPACREFIVSACPHHQLRTRYAFIVPLELPHFSSTKALKCKPYMTAFKRT